MSALNQRLNQFLVFLIVGGECVGAKDSRRSFVALSCVFLRSGDVVSIDIGEASKYDLQENIVSVL